MIIADRLREIREHKNLSQGDIEERTGLLRCYISRVENGHTVPAVETLEKLARAFEMPLYQLLYDGDEPPRPAAPAVPRTSKSDRWGSSGKEARFFHKLSHLLSRMDADDRGLLLYMAQKLARKKSGEKAP
jgi:transcriptional regulator with XRE-family HTH domain